MDSSRLLEVALAAAHDAVAVQRRYLGQVRIQDWSEKGAADFVTHVDREAEAAIVARIGDAFPDHAVLAEEAASDAGSNAPVGRSDWLWIVDPLDGTTNYLHAFPTFATSIGVAHRGELVVGLVMQGVTGEVWSAVRGGGAMHEGRPIRVSSVDTLRLALVGTGFPYRYVETIPAYLRQLDAVMRHAAGVRRAGSAALDLCHLAMGHFDGFWEQRLAPWDVAAGTLIVREAGGVVSDLAGAPSVLEGGSILAGSPRIHQQLGDLLRAAETSGAVKG